LAGSRINAQQVSSGYSFGETKYLKLVEPRGTEIFYDNQEINIKWVSANIDKINISDFTLHSIGVILFKQKEEKLFLKFISDTLSKIPLISLPKNKYRNITNITKKYKFDFDDSYHYSVCKYFGWKLVTMDFDFKFNDKEIIFL
jgi:predicted nucleic acid-binding protein